MADWSHAEAFNAMQTSTMFSSVLLAVGSGLASVSLMWFPLSVKLLLKADLLISVISPILITCAGTKQLHKHKARTVSLKGKSPPNLGTELQLTELMLHATALVVQLRQQRCDVPIANVQALL